MLYLFRTVLLPLAIGAWAASQLNDGTPRTSNSVTMDDNHSNHSYPMYMMKMYFHFLGQEPLFFKSWKLDTTRFVLGASLSLGLLAALYEGLKLFRDHLMLETLEKLKESRIYSIDERTPLFGDDPPFKAGKKLRRKPLLGHFLQTFLHMLQVAVSYILMLAVMTYNAGLLIAIVVGSGVGYFVLTLYVSEDEDPRSTSKRSDHCS